MSPIGSRCSGSRWSKALRSLMPFALSLLLGLSGGMAWCQAPSNEAPSSAMDPQWNFRFDVFQLLLQQSGLRVEKNIAKAIANPRASVIVTMGNVDRSRTAEWTDLRNFVDRGGKLMIAADGHFYSPGFGTINQGPVTTKNPAQKFQGFEDCIRIQSFSSIHPVSRGLTEVVTNRTGWIDAQSKRLTWEDLLLLPDGRENRRPQPSNRMTAKPSDGKPLLSIGYSQRSDDGFVVLVADPSVFSNGMLWFANNGELATAIATELASEKRTTLVMIVDSIVQPPVILPPTPKQEEATPEIRLPTENPTPQINSLLQVANAALKEVADPVQINDNLRDRPRNATLESYSRWIWTAASAIVIGFVLWQLLNRSTWFVPYKTSRQMKTARDLLTASRPVDLQNKIASETLAREFSRLWTGRNTDSEWRNCLDQLKHTNEDRLSAKDRTAVESIMAIAIFGGKATMADVELEKLCGTMQNLLQRFRSGATTNA